MMMDIEITVTTQKYADCRSNLPIIMINLELCANRDMAAAQY